MKIFPISLGGSLVHFLNCNLCEITDQFDLAHLAIKKKVWHSNCYIPPLGGDWDNYVTFSQAICLICNELAPFRDQKNVAIEIAYNFRYSFHKRISG